MENFDYYKVVEDFFKERGMHYRLGYEDEEQKTFITTIAGMGNLPCLQVVVEAYALGAIKIKTYLAYNTPEEKFDDMLEAVNQVNQQYRFIKSSIDSDGDVEACYDFFMEANDMAEEQMGSNFGAVVTGMNEAYPYIARVVLS